MTKLTPRQEALLAHADDADNRYRSAKLNARKRAQEMVEQEVAQFAAARDKAVWDAIESGIPKRQVGMVALKTTSPNTVQEIYNRVREAQELVEVELAASYAPPYEWSAILVHPVSKLQFVFLQVPDDEHWTVDDDGYMSGSGYLYYEPYPGQGWLPHPTDKPPVEAQEWAKENPPQ